jgi:pilus assembly protein Flp/PilA
LVLTAEAAIASAVIVGWREKETRDFSPPFHPDRLRTPVTASEIAMNKLCLKVQRFLESEDGPTAVEYAVMLALIVIVCLTAIRSIGTNANTTFGNVAKELG